MSLYRGAGGASDATDDSTVNAVAGYASSAASSASAAAASASTASSNADAAAASAASAATNVSQAAASAATAESASTFATGRATSAFNSAATATSAASAANISAGSAATSAANAATSNSSASTHATNAANSATAAAGSATSAANSAASALAIYGNTAAMEEAVADAIEAAANAQQEAQDASASAVASAASAAAAYEHEQNAGEWASQAQGSANSAQGFATAAQAARDATLEAYDNFDDRYLGVKTSDPTVDNDGNPLVPGALYFNSSTNMMMLRAGGVWVAAYTSGGSPSFGSIVVNGSGSFASGSASSPTITNIGSENTGLFFPSAFNLGFSTSGSERMRLNAVGNLGIGTVSPTALLDVNGTLNVTGVSTFSSGTAAAPAITTTGDTNTGIFFPAADTIAFSEGGVEALRIDASGNLGLGTTTPNARLSVRTTGAQVDISTSATQVTFEAIDRAAIANPVDMRFFARNGTFQWHNSSYAERMRLDPNGNLGLGTTPLNTGGLIMNVFGAGNGIWSSNSRQLISTSNAYFGGLGWTYAASTFAAAQYSMNNGLHAWLIAPTGTAGTAVTFTQAMTLNGSGNLSIGTTASGGRLDVRDDNRTGNAANQVIYTTTAQAAGVGGTLGLGGLFDATTSTMFGTIRGGKENSTSGNYAGYLSFGTVANGASIVERARIDSSGNLLVGATTAFNGANTIFKGGSTNDLQLTVGGSGSVPGVAIHFGNNTGTANAANSLMKLGTMGVTNRSISAAGTINASGADYAEYMTKAGDFTIAKGDVVGINSEGKLTNVFADAISFCVKSTDPSYVGGDSWGCGLDNDPEALEAARQKVDRIAFAGQVPVNVLGATPGQYIVPVEDGGAIKGVAKNEGDMTIVDYMKAVGRVISIQDDGRAFIIVKVA